jgi:hypothetical protein
MMIAQRVVDDASLGHPPHIITSLPIISCGITAMI